MIRRRDLLTGAPALLLPRRASGAERPNILFCIADDWSFGHAGIYGDPVVRTPTFDRMAREGVLFTNAFTAAPTCTASRAAILTGQALHRLEEGGNLYGPLPAKFPVYPDLLEDAGYAVGYTRKGWGPGNFKAGGRSRNPAGPQFKDFAEFLKARAPGKPFCFWFGSTDPHRPYDLGSGAQAGMPPGDVRVPPFWPDLPEVRSDVLDYYAEVQRFDSEVGGLLRLLEETGQAANTLVMITGDNGWPFPRAKANLYDAGAREPLAVRWPAAVKTGRTLQDFVSLADVAPTILEAAGLPVPSAMTGRSIAGLLSGKEESGSRDRVFVERERHAQTRKGDLSYPARSVRTLDFLYIRNFRPDRWPAGDPEQYVSVGPYGDCDNSPTKTAILERRNEPAFERFYKLAFAKRPAEELYDVRKDPHQLRNVVEEDDYASARRQMRAILDTWMKETSDPRASSDDNRWDKYPYNPGASAAPARSKSK